MKRRAKLKMRSILELILECRFECLASCFELEQFRFH